MFWVTSDWVVVAADPEGRDGGKADHLYHEGYEACEPELELLVGSWHGDDTSHVTKDENLKSQLDLGLSLDAELGASCAVEGLEQVGQAPRQAPLSPKEVVDIR